MIIDAYNTTQNVRGRSDYLTGVRPGEAPPPHVPFDPSRILGRMDAAGVDMAMVCSLAQRIENDFIIELVRRHPDRFIGFGQVMPQADDALAEIGRIAGEGLVGLKLHPSLHGYHVADHGLLDPVFDRCAELGLPVLVNALDDPFCAPFAIEEIARSHPEVPTIIAHMGAVWNVPEAIIVAERNPNVYLETSATLLSDVRRAYARLGSAKILLGTEWPGSDFDLERMKIAKAIPDEADRALIEGGNLAALLGLRSPAPRQMAAIPVPAEVAAPADMPALDVELLRAAEALLAACWAQGRHEVATALRLRDGSVHRGVHLEGSCRRSSVCAEGIALGAARGARPDGPLDVVSVVSVQVKPAGQFRVIAPCGVCRELITDYAPGARVWLTEPVTGLVVARAALDLLPEKTRRSW